MNFTLNDKQKSEFMQKAVRASWKSSCGYRVGCVGVIPYENFHKEIDGEFIKTDGKLTWIKSFNETVKGEKYCQIFDEHGNRLCIRVMENLKGKEFEKVCSIHAEVNMIAKCAKYGIKTEGMVLFLTNSPCYICAKSIIQSGIKGVYYQAEHTDIKGVELISRNGYIKIQKLGARI